MKQELIRQRVKEIFEKYPEFRNLILSLIFMLSAPTIINNAQEGVPDNDEPEPIPAPMAEEEEVVIFITVNNGGANLRSDASVNLSAIGKVGGGTKLEVLTTINDGQLVNESIIWYEVKLEDGTTAFVHSSTVGEPETIIITISDQETFEPAPTPEEAGDEPTPDPNETSEGEGEIVTGIENVPEATLVANASGIVEEHRVNHVENRDGQEVLVDLDPQKTILTYFYHNADQYE